MAASSFFFKTSLSLYSSHKDEVLTVEFLGFGLESILGVQLYHRDHLRNGDESLFLLEDSDRHERVSVVRADSKPEDSKKIIPTFFRFLSYETGTFSFPNNTQSLNQALLTVAMFFGLCLSRVPRVQRSRAREEPVPCPGRLLLLMLLWMRKRMLCMLQLLLQGNPLRPPGQLNNFSKVL